MKAVAIPFVLSLLVQAHVHDGPYGPDFAQADAKVKAWLRQQQIPNAEALGLGINSKSCCDERDGLDAREEIRDGHYWTLLPPEAYGTDKPYWVEVPDDRVLTTPNLAYVPVAWYTHENGRVKIRCYAPGVKM